MDSLPGGLQARVEQGAGTSPGARSSGWPSPGPLTKQADLYIFDDSFSALDFQTDAALRHALRQEVAGSAVLIIAQRVSTIAHADQIIVLEDGRAVGIGRHEELLETCPVYRGDCPIPRERRGELMEEQKKTRGRQGAIPCLTGGFDTAVPGAPGPPSSGSGTPQDQHLRLLVVVPVGGLLHGPGHRRPLLQREGLWTCCGRTSSGPRGWGGLCGHLEAGGTGRSLCSCSSTWAPGGYLAVLPHGGLCRAAEPPAAPGDE